MCRCLWAVATLKCCNIRLGRLRLNRVTNAKNSIRFCGPTVMQPPLVACFVLLFASLSLCGHPQHPARADLTPRSEPETLLRLKLRTRVELHSGSGNYHIEARAEDWDSSSTALIVCDMWDLHHC